MVGIASMCFGALGGMLFSPQPASAVSREIVELQQQISQVLQQQQDLRSAVDTNSATLKTLVQQSLDSTNQLNGQMGNLQKDRAGSAGQYGIEHHFGDANHAGLAGQSAGSAGARRQAFSAADGYAESAAEHRREGFRQCSCQRGAHRECRLRPARSRNASRRI